MTLADMIKAGKVEPWLALNEVLKAVKDNRDNAISDVEMWLAQGLDYDEINESYDEGYINALNWVIRIIKEGDFNV